MTGPDRIVVTPEDDAFVADFESGQIANQRFHHRDHLRLAWVLIHHLGLERASERLTKMIRLFAAHHGSADRYNDTMTRFWVRVVGIAISRHPDVRFDSLVVSEPHLLDKNLPLKHWTREALAASEAKARWVEPDLVPIPSR